MLITLTGDDDELILKRPFYYNTYHSYKNGS